MAAFGAAVLVVAAFGVAVLAAADGRRSSGGAHGSCGLDCGAVSVAAGPGTSAVGPPCFGAAVPVTADFDMTAPDTADGRRSPGDAHGSRVPGCAAAPATAGSGTSAVGAPAVDTADSVTVGSDTAIPVAADDFRPSGGVHAPCGSGCAASAMGPGTSAVDTPRFGTAGSDTPAVDTAATAAPGTAVPVSADASRPSSGAHGSRGSGCAAAPATAAVGSGVSAVGAPGLDTPDFGAADFVAPDASRPPTGAHASRGSGC